MSSVASSAGPVSAQRVCWLRRFVSCEQAMSNAMVAAYRNSAHTLHGDGFKFDNITAEFKLFFRVASHGSTNAEFQVGVDATDPKLCDVLANELYGYFDDDAFVDMSSLPPSAESVAAVMALINGLWSWQLCVCGKMMVKHGNGRCHEKVTRRHGAALECCGANTQVHRRCMYRWTTFNNSCPCCRKEYSSVYSFSGMT